MEYPYLSRVTGDQIRTPDVDRTANLACAARLGFVCFAPISLPNCSSRYHSSRAEERREWMALKC